MYANNNPTSRILGHADGSNAPAGEIGEYIQAYGTGTGMGASGSGVATLLAGPIFLTTGDWDVSGCASLLCTGTVTITALTCGVSYRLTPGPIGLTNLNDGADNFSTFYGCTVYGVYNVQFNPAATGFTGYLQFHIQACRAVIPPGAASPVNFGIVSQTTWSGGGLTGQGNIRARRMR